MWQCWNFVARVILLQYCCHTLYEHLSRTQTFTAIWHWTVGDPGSKIYLYTGCSSVAVTFLVPDIQNQPGFRAVRLWKSISRVSSKVYGKDFNWYRLRLQRWECVFTSPEGWSKLDPLSPLCRRFLTSFLLNSSVATPRTRTWPSEK